MPLSYLLLSSVWTSTAQEMEVNHHKNSTHTIAFVIKPSCETILGFDSQELAVGVVTALYRLFNDQ